MKVISIMFLAFLLGCSVKAEYVPIPTQVRTDTIFVRDSLPVEFTSEFFWNTIWANERLAGVTFCYGQYGAISRINPYITDIPTIIAATSHETVHRQQIARLSCPQMRRMNVTPEGQAILEAEAYAVANNVHGDSLITILKLYPRVSLLSTDSLKKVIQEYY